MFLTLKEHLDAIHKALDAHPEYVCISTYGIHTGVSADGRLWGNSTTTLFRRLSTLPTLSKVLVGVTPGDRTAVKCVRANAENWCNIEFRTSISNHLKCWIFHYRIGGPRALVGSRNCADSTWNELSLWLPDKHVHKLTTWFLNEWDRTPVLMAPRKEKLKLRSKGKTL